MNPVFKFNLILSLRLHKFIFFVCGILRLYFELRSSLFNFRKFIHSLSDNSCPLHNPSDLSPKEMLFLSEEEWVCNNVSFEISSEKYFNHPRSLDVTRKEIGKTLPFR